MCDEIFATARQPVPNHYGPNNPEAPRVCFQDTHTQCRRRWLKGSRELQPGLSSRGLAQFEMKRTCLIGRRSAQPSHPLSKIQEIPRMAELWPDLFSENPLFRQAARGLWVLSDSSGPRLGRLRGQPWHSRDAPLYTRAHTGRVESAEFEVVCRSQNRAR